jgi:hypothetical protein
MAMGKGLIEVINAAAIPRMVPRFSRVAVRVAASGDEGFCGPTFAHNLPASRSLFTTDNNCAISAPSPSRIASKNSTTAGQWPPSFNLILIRGNSSMPCR